MGSVEDTVLELTVDEMWDAGPELDEPFSTPSTRPRPPARPTLRMPKVDLDRLRAECDPKRYKTVPVMQAVRT